MSIASVTVKTKPVTGDELLAMGDIGPCELIDGRIIYMTPAGAEHGLIEFYLGSELSIFVRKHNLGWVMGGETGIYTHRNPDRIRGADIIFLSKERSAAKPGSGFLDVAPDLIVEVMSPHDTWQEVHLKLEEYFAVGIHRVWVVEPKNRVVQIYTSPTNVQKLTESDTLAGEGVLSGFAVSVSNIFAD